MHVLMRTVRAAAIGRVHGVARGITELSFVLVCVERYGQDAAGNSPDPANVRILETVAMLQSISILSHGVVDGG